MKELYHYWYSEEASTARHRLGDPKTFAIISGVEIEYTCAHKERECSCSTSNKVYLGQGYSSRIGNKR